MSLIPTRPHTFLEIDREIFSIVILLLLIQEGLLSNSRRAVVSYKGKYVH